MNRIASISLALFLIALPCSIVASSAAAAQEPASKVDSARAYTEEFNRGVAALRAKKWDEGIASMKRCIELAPEDSASAYNIACAYGLQGQVDPGVEWFQKAASWGFGYDAFVDLLDLAETDTDIDALRKDPRFVTALDSIRARNKSIVSYIETPAVYVPKAVGAGGPMPVLVVLHPSGATKDAVVTSRWMQVADQLGCALVAPSPRILASRDPKQGMVWYTSFADYAKPDRSPLYESSIDKALDAFAKQHEIDRSRVYLAGDQEGGMVALRVAFAHPDRWKGVVATEAAFEESLVKPNAEAAKKAGLKVKILIDRDAFAKRLAADPTKSIDPDTVIKAWTEHLDALGFPGAIEAWTKEPPSGITSPADPLTVRLVARLRAMQPATAEAAAPK